MSKTLIFEGAGWAEADSSKASDVGNCRIRSTFVNKNGTEIYIELLGFPPHQWSLERQKAFKVAGHVSHLFDTKDRNSGRSMGLSRLEGHSFEYDKAHILGLVNSIEVGGDFDSIEVRNDNWNGFRADGLEASDETK